MHLIYSQHNNICTKKSNEPILDRFRAYEFSIAPLGSPAQPHYTESDKQVRDVMKPPVILNWYVFVVQMHSTKTHTAHELKTTT